MRHRIYVLPLAVLELFAAFAFLFVMGTTAVFAAELEDVAPTPSNSYNQSGNPQPNIHVFMIRKASGMGVQPDVKLASYTKTDPSGGTFAIKPGTSDSSAFVCDRPADRSNFPDARYISVTVGDADGDPVQTSYISYDKACTNNQARTNTWLENPNNVFYANYNIPNGNYQVDSETGRYKVLITVAYHDQVPNGGAAPNLVQQRFKVNMSMSGSKLGPYAQNDTSFPIVGDWDIKDDPNPKIIKVPFGLKCSAPSDVTNAKIGVYDADNGVFTSRVRFYVQRYDDATDTWVTVNIHNGFGGTMEAGQVYRPDDRAANNADYQYALIDTFKKQTRYQMVITGLMPRNTVDINVPGDTIYGAIDCGWNIKPTSAVFPSTQMPGGQVTFSHTAENTGGSPSTNVKSTVYWGKTGMNTTGSLSTDTRVYQAAGNTGDSAGFTNAFTIPAGATAGQTYCQYLRVNPRKSGESPAVDRDSDPPACVTVAGTPPPADETVNIIPYAYGGSDIEPTETTTINGGVNVTHFPEWTQWGYKQYSMRADATREPVLAYGWLETDSETTGYSSNTTYSCDHPNDYNRVGSTCYHHYLADDTKAKCDADGHLWNSYLGSGCRDTHGANANTTYYCPSSYPIDTGSGCKRKRYRCNDTPPPAWGPWNGSQPNCSLKYRCDSSGAGLDWSTDPPKCKAWTCPYAPSTYIYSSTKPLCEFRCDSGTGIVAYNGSPNYSSPCYRQPSFTLNCFWTSGTTTSQTVTANGTYCQTGVSGVGKFIGTPVCATISSNYPTGGWNGWTPDWAPPGYMVDPEPGGNGTNPRQAVVWGFTRPPASATGCTRVVGKPTTKIFGGDLAVGGSFPDQKSGVACGGGTSASIIGWPHSPAYNAANSQLAAFASQNITGFATGALRSNAATQPPSGLAFANTTAGGSKFGGDFGMMPCIGDHAFSMPSNLTIMNIGSGALNSPNTKGSYMLSSGQINSSPTIRKGSQVTLYIEDQNVYIGGSGIRYERGGWIEPKDIPAFKLVVYGGNIYIEPGVTELNGIYVAQPKGWAQTGGHIYTCATGASEYAPGSRYDSCRTPLTVNGSFIAKQVHLGRTLGTAIYGETGERFNYLPEMWISQWPQDNTSTNIKYDAILSLPPIL